MTTESTVQSTIDKAWSVADQSTEKAFDYASKAVSSANSSLINSFYKQGLNIGEPTVYGLGKISQMLNEVNDILGNDLVNRKRQLFSDLVEKSTGLESIFAQGATFDSKDQLQLLDTLSDAFTDEFTFGSGAGGFSQTVNDLSTFLTSGLVYDNAGNVQALPYGVPEDVEDRMRDRAFDAVTRETQREEDEVIGTFASRGFPVPPGMMARRIEEVRDKGQRNKSNVSRDVFVDQGKRAFEATGRYLQQFQQLQVQTKDMFMEYLQAAMRANSGKADDMKFLIEAIIKLRQAVIDMYAHIKDDRELLLKEAIAEWDIGIKESEIDSDYFAKKVATKVEATISAAQAMGNLASAAVGSQNTMATMAHETVAQE